MKHPTGMEKTDKITYKKVKSYQITRRNVEKHFFYKYQSYGISIVELQEFPKGTTHVLIIERSDKREGVNYYLSEIKQWENGLLWNHILKDNTPDPQKHIRVRDMILYKSLGDIPEPQEIGRII